VRIVDRIPWSDPRFMELCIKLKDPRTVVGAVVLAWREADKKHPIPVADWKRAGIGQEMIEVGLAKETKNGIYLCDFEKPKPEGAVLDSLTSIADCLEGISLSAQRSWVEEFGEKTVLSVIPTAYAAWLHAQPRSSYTHQITPLPLYLKRCMKNEGRYPTQLPDDGSGLLQRIEESEKKRQK
jgi:hypothetical protein